MKLLCDRIVGAFAQFPFLHSAGREIIQILSVEHRKSPYEGWMDSTFLVSFVNPLERAVRPAVAERGNKFAS
jgi:hypothetical protein